MQSTQHLIAHISKQSHFTYMKNETQN